MDAPGFDKDARNREIDWERCIICQKHNKKQKLVCPAKSKKDDRGAEYKTFINNVVELNTLVDQADVFDLSVFGG